MSPWSEPALAWGEAEPGALSDALLRFRFVASRLCDLARTPLTLERCFIGSLVGSGSILSGLGRTPEVAPAVFPFGCVVFESGN